MNYERPGGEGRYPRHFFRFILSEGATMMYSWPGTKMRSLCALLCFSFLRTCGVGSVCRLPARRFDGSKDDSNVPQRVTVLFLSVGKRIFCHCELRDCWKIGRKNSGLSSSRVVRVCLCVCLSLCATPERCYLKHDVNFPRRWLWLRASHAAHINCVGNGV